MNKLNKKQRLTIKIGVGLIILSGLFPPYEGVYLETGDNLTVFIGYRPLIFPPSRKSVVDTFASPESVFSESEYAKYGALASSRILVSTVLLQILVIVLATCGLVVVTAGEDDETAEKRESFFDKLRLKLHSLISHRATNDRMRAMRFKERSPPREDED